LYLAARNRRDACVDFIKKSTSLRFQEPEMKFPHKIKFTLDSTSVLYPTVTGATVEGLLHHLVYDKYSGIGKFLEFSYKSR
jgi:hypothetical protein